ncbi:MAG: SagB/ThcOx family dehydrogenase [Nitrospirales bacterium]
MEKLWQKLFLPRVEEYQVWEVFHENSKGSQYHNGPSEQEVIKKMGQLHESLPFVGYPVVPLPEPIKRLNCPLDQALSFRRSSRSFIPTTIDLAQLSAILYFTYGVSLDKNKTELFRSYRMSPSAGALYPLEIFFHSTQVRGLNPGIYHYNPLHHHLRLIKEGDATAEVDSAMVQKDLTNNALLTIFISAVFERSIFKYGNRGYRFIFLEAGHVAQNINLVSGALGLGCINIGGFFDRQIDSLLGFDGLTQSTIYIVATGKIRKHFDNASPNSKGAMQ